LLLSFKLLYPQDSRRTYAIFLIKDSLRDEIPRKKSYTRFLEIVLQKFRNIASPNSQARQCHAKNSAKRPAPRCIYAIFQKNYGDFVRKTVRRFKTKVALAAYWGEKS
jgi:hypothetical protein